MFVQCPLNMLNKILTSLGELNNFTLFWDIYDAENFMHNDPILIRYQPALDSKNQKLSAMWRSVTNDSTQHCVTLSINRSMDTMHRMRMCDYVAH